LGFEVFGTRIAASFDLSSRRLLSRTWTPDRRHSRPQHRGADSWRPDVVYQLAALAGTLQTGAEFLIDVDDSVANAELIDEAYRRPGL